MYDFDMELGRWAVKSGLAQGEILHSSGPAGSPSHFPFFFGGGGEGIFHELYSFC